MELSIEGNIRSDKETIITHKPNEFLLETRAEEVRAIITVLYYQWASQSKSIPINKLSRDE